MTRLPELIGPEYDSPARLASRLSYYEAKQRPALLRLERAEKEADAEAALVLRWELGLLDLRVTPAEGTTPYGLGPYEAYAEYYGFTPATLSYAAERAYETQDIILGIHYREFILLRSDQRGGEWIRRQKELLELYRVYIEGCKAGAANDEERHAGVYIDSALARVSELLPVRGLLRSSEHREWADWFVALARDSRSWPVKDPHAIDQLRHRWVAPYLLHLAVLPADAVEATARAQALLLIKNAAAYYRSTPFNDHFTRRVAEIDATLRKCWGEENTHERQIRAAFEAALARAEFERTQGNSLIAAHFYRDARRTAEVHRQYFTAAEGDDGLHPRHASRNDNSSARAGPS